MIQISTAPVDEFGHRQNTMELHPGIYRDPDTSEVFVSDGQQTVIIQIIPE